MVINNECKSCGGKLNFNPITQKLMCTYCRQEQEINVKNNRDTNLEIKEDINVIRCPNCGAQVLTKDNELSTFCIYCRSNAVLRGKLDGKYSPDVLIPFRKTKEDAVKAFESVQHSHKFLPEEFLDKNNIEEIRGIYIPFWLMDIDVQGEMTATTKVTKIIDGIDEGSYKENIKEYLNTRNGNISYKLVPIDASTHFDDTIMQNIEPFNYDDVKDYSPEYLFGYLSEIYDVDSETALEIAHERIKKSSYDIFRKTLIGGTPVDIEVKKFEHKSTIISKKYALLPVYMLNVKYENKIYTFAMNGQTGKITGTFPTSNNKERLYFISILVISFLIIIAVVWAVFEINKGLSLLLIFLPPIIATTFLNIEKQKTKNLIKNKKINEYIADRFVEKRKSELTREKEIKHDSSRAAKVIAPLVIGSAGLAISTVKGNKK